MNKWLKTFLILLTCCLPLLTAWVYMVMHVASLAILIGMMLTCEAMMICSFYTLFKDRE